MRCWGSVPIELLGQLAKGGLYASGRVRLTTTSAQRHWFGTLEGWGEGIIKDRECSVSLMTVTNTAGADTQYPAIVFPP